jgi:hypothetical protein
MHGRLRRFPPRAAAIAGAAAVLLALYAAGAFSPPPLPGDRLGWRRFHTPELAGRQRMGQRFRMNADGLAAIDIYPVAVGEVQGRIRLELQTWNGVVGTTIRRAEVAAADFVRNDAYRFEFGRVPGSRGRLYQLVVSSADEAARTGVALEATKGERFSEGALLANGSERWADLAFAVHAVPPPPPPVWVNVRHPLVQFTYAGLALAWVAVAYALRQFTYHYNPRHEHHQAHVD